jgi:putative GTP pyrophosphokinase
MDNNFDDIINFYKSDEISSKANRFKNQVEDFFKLNHKLHSYPLPAIHTIKSRIKSFESLVGKLNRKTNEGKIINKENFFTQITDLIGIRVLHIYLEQFEIIHTEILSQIDNGEWEFYEEPKAYSWDDDTINIYKELGINTIKKDQYTSVHYVVRIKNRDDKPIYCEIQVRTLFEEIWGEIDHTINYPNKTFSIACQSQLKDLSKMIMTGRGMVDSVLKSHREYLQNQNIDAKSNNNGQIIEIVSSNNEKINKFIQNGKSNKNKASHTLLIFSDYAKADEKFPIFESNILTQIISNLRIYNWYVQNPAIELLLEQDLNTLEENQDNSDRLFVLGRNIYQSACGGANNSVDLIQNFISFFEKNSDYVINNIFSGILYEIYFDSKNNLRQNLKANFKNEVFALKVIIRLEESANFIKESLNLTRFNLQ